MARNLIATKLVESVRSRAMIPDDTLVYTDEAILEILNEEIDVGLLDTLLTLHEEHLVTYTDTKAINQDEMRKRLVIPHRAVGSKLRDVHALVGQSAYELSRISLEEIGDYNNYPYVNYVGTDLFYVEGDEIVVVSPRSGTAGMFRLYYHIRPNVIVMEDKCAQITEIDTTTGILSFSTVPSSFSSLVKFDLVQNNTPNKILATDLEVVEVSVANKTVELDPTSIPTRLQVGDWVCFPEESPYPNLPTELHPILAQRAAVYILEAMGDAQNLSNARSKLAQMEKSVQKLLDNRVEGANKKIKSRHGFLQNKMGSRNRVRRGRW